MTCSNWSTLRCQSGNDPPTVSAAAPVLLFTRTHWPVRVPEESRLVSVTRLYDEANAAESASFASTRLSSPVCVTGLGKNTVPAAVFAKVAADAGDAATTARITAAVAATARIFRWVGTRMGPSALTAFLGARTLRDRRRGRYLC